MSKKKVPKLNLNQHHNIIVPKDKPWRGHQMATDGKQGDDQKTIDRKNREIQYIKDHYHTLRGKNIKCDIKHDERVVNAKPAVVGMFKGNPFVVYIKWILQGKEWCGIVATRYKGEDVDMIAPHEVLK